MALQLQVPNLVDDQSAQAITKAISVVDPTAKVEVDTDAHTVTVSSESGAAVASEESIKQAIVAAGYSLG